MGGTSWLSNPKTGSKYLSVTPSFLRLREGHIPAIPPGTQERGQQQRGPWLFFSQHLIRSLSSGRNSKTCSYLLKGLGSVTFLKAGSLKQVLFRLHSKSRRNFKSERLLNFNPNRLDTRKTKRTFSIFPPKYLYFLPLLFLLLTNLLLWPSEYSLQIFPSSCSPVTPGKPTHPLLCVGDIQAQKGFPTERTPLNTCTGHAARRTAPGLFWEARREANNSKGLFWAQWAHRPDQQPPFEKSSLQGHQLGARSLWFQILLPLSQWFILERNTPTRGSLFLGST